MQKILASFMLTTLLAPSLPALAANATEEPKALTEAEARALIEETLKAAGLGRYVLPKNKGIQEAIIANSDKLIKLLGDRFAGGWVAFDSDDTMYQAVAVTSPVSIDKDFAEQTRMKFIIVQYNLKTLRAFADIVVQDFMSDASNSVFSIAVDVMTNRVDVRAPEKEFETLSAQMIRKGYDMNMISFSVMNGPPIPTTGREK